MKISECRCRLAWWFVITAGCMVGVVSIQAADPPDPWILLQGLHSARMQVPPSSLKLQMTYADPLVTNVFVTTVDFDGERRGFHDLNSSMADPGWQSLFDGTRVTTYNQNVNQVSYRTLETQNGARLFDPRVLGLVSVYAWKESLDSRFPTQDLGWTAEIIGREEINGRPAWHLLAKMKNVEMDFWIDETKGFRLYRYDLNGVQTISHYDNPAYPWLPNLVVSKIYRHRQPSPDEVAPKTRTVEVLEARSNVKFPKNRWSLAAMTLKPGADIVDQGLQRSVGRWNGKRVLPVQGDVEAPPPRNLTGFFLTLIAVVMCGPVLFYFRSGKGPKVEGS
ncbi:MAG TPA: hypothetical protein VGF13_19100, partial [Verrucomicrobiae bacterium]